MSYYTQYTLSDKNIKSKREFDKLNCYIKNHADMNDSLAFDTYDENTEVIEAYAKNVTKWYSHVDDMVEMSRNFPNMVFKLSGAGETQEDIWDEYYENGDMERCDAELVLPKPQKIEWD